MTLVGCKRSHSVFKTQGNCQMRCHTPATPAPREGGDGEESGREGGDGGDENRANPRPASGDHAAKGGEHKHRELAICVQGACCGLDDEKRSAHA